MNTPSVEERLAHSQARLETVEKLLADKSRSLLLANQQVERADIRLKNIQLMFFTETYFVKCLEGLRIPENTIQI